MNPSNAVDAYHLGWAAALLYAQAYNDEEGGKQTLVSHLPKPEYEDGGISFDKDKLNKALGVLDEESSVSVWRFGKGKWDTTTIEIGSSEGHFGLPDWS